MIFSKIKLFGLLALSYSLIACGQTPVSTASDATPNAIAQTTTAPQPTAIPVAVAKSLEPQSSAKSKTAQIPWIESEKAPDSTLEMAILKDDPISSSSTRVNTYRYAKVDLNGDVSPEVVVHLIGSSFCGTGGCTTLIFQQLRGQYQLIGSIPTSHPPIVVSGNTSNGWNDLIVYTRDAVPMLVKFEDKGYGQKVDLAPSADLSGTYLFAKEYRKYQGAEFRLTPSPRKAKSACQGEEKSLVKKTTQNYTINICGVTTPEYYVGTEKADPTKSIRLPLTQASPTLIMALNGDVTYTLAQTPTGNFLTVTQGQKELLREVVEGW
jgi:hypothetical protein